MNLNNKLNKKYTLVSLYVIVTAVIIYCLSLIADNLPEIMNVIMDKVRWFASVTTPIVIGFVFAYLFEPIVNFIESKLKKIRIRKKELKSSRTLSVLFTVILFFLLVAGVISLLVFSVTDQLRLASLDDIIILADTYLKYFNTFYTTSLNKLNELNIQSSQIAEYIESATTYILNTLQSFGLSFVNSLKNLSSYLTTFLFSLIIAIYFLIDGAMIKEYVKKVGRALLNDKWLRRIGTFISDADHVFSGYVRGQLMDALVMMVAISLTLSIIGVKFGLIIGILAGIGNLIPYCGPIVAYIGTTLVCVLNGQYKELVIALIALLIVQTIDGNIIAPKLLSNSIQIHPVLVIIFLIFGNAIGGLLGMLLAVPVGALVKLLFVRFIDNQLARKEAKEESLENGKVKDMS